MPCFQKGQKSLPLSVKWIRRDLLLSLGLSVQADALWANNLLTGSRYSRERPPALRSGAHPSTHLLLQTCGSEGAARRRTGPLSADGNTLLLGHSSAGWAARELLRSHCREGLPSQDKTLFCCLIADMPRYHSAFHFLKSANHNSRQQLVQMAARRRACVALITAC